MIASGEYADGTWLALHWLEGPSLPTRFAPLREGSQDGPARTEALTAALDATRTVAELHEAGWVHGDLQPAHFLHTAHGTRLIDLALAQGPPGAVPAELEVPYRGALTHLTAPETAAQLTARGTAVLNPAAETHTLAATLRTSLTGAWPFPTDLPGSTRSQKLAALAERRHPPAPKDTNYPALAALLDEVLTAPPRARPTARALGTAIAALLPGS
jgi:serine/threonine protein kinase